LYSRERMARTIGESSVQLSAWPEATSVPWTSWSLEQRLTPGRYAEANAKVTCFGTEATYRPLDLILVLEQGLIKRTKPVLEADLQSLESYGPHCFENRH
jgi:hypothetical protein